MTMTATPPVPQQSTTGTVLDLWRERGSYLVEQGGEWVELPFAAADDRIRELANGLLAFGVAKGDVVAILGRTSLEWALFDFAVARVGAVAVGLYVESS